MSFMNALRFGLKETTIQKLCGVFAKYPQVSKAVIYGSRAKGNYKNGSDIDHLTFSFRPANASFYRDLLTFLGWRLMYDSPDTFGMTNGGALSLHFGPNTKDVANNYDAPIMFETPDRILVEIVYMVPK